MQRARTWPPSRIRRRVVLRRSWREAFILSGRFVFPFFVGVAFGVAFFLKPLEIAATSADKSYQQVLKVCQR